MVEKLIEIENKFEYETEKIKVIKVDGKRIAIIKTEENIYAIDDTCTHEEQSLSDGMIDENEIECPKHGARFDIKTGKVKALPAVLPLKTYKVEKNNNKLIIHIPINIE